MQGVKGNAANAAAGKVPEGKLFAGKQGGEDAKAGDKTRQTNDGVPVDTGFHGELKPMTEMKSAPEVKVKPVILGGHQIVLYSKALHPQHVAMHGRRTVAGRNYELEAWIMEGSHALRLESGALCATELVCEFDRRIPTAGIVLMHVVNAEKDVEHRFAKQGVRYVSSIQLETLAPNLYYETYEEYVRLAKANGHLAHMWSQPEGQGLSVLEIERESTLVTALGYHLIPATGTVVRTQTMFEMTQKAAAVR
jgi:hypothetical protein